jgi:cytochrome P450
MPVWVQTLLYGLRQTEFLEWCHRRYGDVFVIRLPGGGSEVVLADPQAIKEVMALDADDFAAAAIAPILEPFLGPRSLLLLDGEQHRVQRRAMVHSLHGAAMSEYVTVMIDATERSIESWPIGGSFPLLPRLQAITLDVIAQVIFGADEPAGRAEIIRALRPWLDQGRSALLLVEPLRHELGGHGPWGRFVAQRLVIDDVLGRLIAARRIDKRLDDRTDALSRLLLAEEDLDDMCIRDQLMTMLAAGHDTSATALAWAFCHLLRHPQALTRAVTEIDSGGNDTYLDAAVKETLRLTPVVLEVGRTLTHPTMINGTLIPAGFAASPSALLAQRDPQTYEEPLEFCPERFLGRPADPHTWLPFGGGIRRCIGAQFATTEIKTVLRTVLATTELQPVGRMERPRRRAVTMIPSRGARVRLVSRRTRIDAVEPTPSLDNRAPTDSE